MYIVYEEHIEQLEEENDELQKEVIALRRRLSYYKTMVEVEEDE
jgi:regulator of replication initiation timing